MRRQSLKTLPSSRYISLSLYYLCFQQTNSDFIFNYDRNTFRYTISPFQYSRRGLKQSSPRLFLVFSIALYSTLLYVSYIKTLYGIPVSTITLYTFTSFSIGPATIFQSLINTTYKNSYLLQFTYRQANLIRLLFPLYKYLISSQVSCLRSLSTNLLYVLLYYQNYYLEDFLYLNTRSIPYYSSSSQLSISILSSNTSYYPLALEGPRLLSLGNLTSFSFPFLAFLLSFSNSFSIRAQIVLVSLESPSPAYNNFIIKSNTLL